MISRSRTQHEHPRQHQRAKLVKTMFINGMLPHYFGLLLTFWVAFYSPVPVEAACGRNPRQVVPVTERLALAVCSPRVIRILRISESSSAEGLPMTAADLVKSRNSLIVQPGYTASDPVVKFTVTRHPHFVNITTSELHVSIVIESNKNEAKSQPQHNPISFYDIATGKLWTQEVACRLDEQNSVQQSWKLMDDPYEEAWFGGGQFVNGLLNYRGAPLLLIQSNTEAAVPFFTSSRGYGILWDHYGITYWNPIPQERQIALEKTQVRTSTMSGIPQTKSIHTRRTTTMTTTMTVSNANNNMSSVSSLHVSYEAQWIAPASGAFWFQVMVCAETTFFCSWQVSSFELYMDAVNDKNQTTTPQCHFELANIPSSVACRIDHLEKDKQYKIRLDLQTSDDNQFQPQLLFTSLSQLKTTTIQSKDTNYMDYYFMASASNYPPANPTSDNVDQSTSSSSSSLWTAFPASSPMDSVMASYREITGSAPLFSKKTYGFWQCKEHYKTQSELLASAQKFRALGIPVDNIVQDWQYWGELGWGPHWDPHIYPDPAGMIQQLHEDHHLNFMVSVWSEFDPRTRFYKEMKEMGLLMNPSTSAYMDAWNPAALAKFVEYIQQAHWDNGVDSIWLDATEPEGSPHLDESIFLGSANEYYNTYSLQVGKATHNGLKEYDGRRVFSLTRSSFAGQQRYGACLWSGDITGSWDSLTRQISMSLNYQLSGHACWSMDTGGFDRPGDQYDNPEYQALLTRWFQFAVFTPIMRVHGCNSNTEIWNYGNTTQDRIVQSALHLRYRLLDYIYSGFARVEHHHFTMQRAMVFDFSYDSNVYNIADQFMFGDRILVAPVHTPDSTRNVYLPELEESGTWTDFYTGEQVGFGQHTLSSIPMDRIPLYIKPSVLVLSPLRQHVFEPLAEERLEVRIYKGGENSNKTMRFVWYQDDGVNGRSDRPYSITTFAWNQSTSCLTVGPTIGSDGTTASLPEVTVDVVLVAPNHGVGVQPTKTPDTSFVFSGAPKSACYENQKMTMQE